MESSHQSNKESWTQTNPDNANQSKIPEHTDSTGEPSQFLQYDTSPSTEHISTPEPTQEALESGAGETMVFLKDRTGRTIPVEQMDSETQKLLFKINETRRNWSPAMESDARAALQTLYPDVRGNRGFNPL